MPTWVYWLIGISTVVIAVAFVLLVIFVIRTLNSLRISLFETDKLLRNTNDVVIDLEKKVHAFDPIFRQVQSIGLSVEERLESARVEKEVKTEKAVGGLYDIVEWGLLGLSLWQRIKGNKGK